MKNETRKLLKGMALVGTTAALLSFVATGYADEDKTTTHQKIVKAENEVKKTARAADDKICETVNGKLKCVPKKIKHKIQNASDSAKESVE